MHYALALPELDGPGLLEEVVAEAAPVALTDEAVGYGFDNEREEVGVMLKAATQDLVDVAETLDMALSATQEKGGAEGAAFKAVPEVIQNGLIVNWESDWKGRGYDSAILSVPIEIVSNGSAQRYYAGVVVIRKDQTQRFYTHEVVLQKEDGTHVVQTGVLNNQYLPGDALHLLIKSILDQINNVNTSEKTSQEQRELSDGETKFSLMSKREYAQFYSRVGEMKAGKRAQFHVSPDGQYVFDIENKLVYTDGKWHNPQIFCVIELKVGNETMTDLARQFVLDGKKEGSSLVEIRGAIEDCFGKGSFLVHMESDGWRNGWQNGRREERDLQALRKVNRGDLSAEEGTRFSLKSPVEETKTLVAVHNLSENKKRTREWFHARDNVVPLGGNPIRGHSQYSRESGGRQA